MLQCFWRTGFIAFVDIGALTALSIEFKILYQRCVNAADDVAMLFLFFYEFAPRRKNKDGER